MDPLNSLACFPTNSEDKFLEKNDDVSPRLNKLNQFMIIKRLFFFKKGK